MEGFNISLLVCGTKIVLETRNSFYEIEIIENSNAFIYGGTKGDDVHFKKQTRVVLNGSTFGGSLIKLDWIGKDMQLELQNGNKRFLTSPIVEATVEGPDGSWSYSMGWKQFDPFLKSKP
jgi:hypothetical protein